MKRFAPCKDRNACSEDGTICSACGRSHEEIAKIRAVVAGVTDFVLAMEYENIDEFLNYLNRKVLKKTAK